jgi:hypothetical protein
MNAPWIAALLRRRIMLAGWALALVFAFLAGRFWHPHYGFTRFIQLDEADRRAGIREVRAHPVFWYEGENGYDGAAYAQIAFHPALDSEELKAAVGHLPYRARRILLSALAWVFAAGDPARIAGTYAALNIAVWAALALLLWRILGVSDARGLVAWAGVMFAAGALHSVRLALTDLLAATLTAWAVWAGERGRGGRAAALIGAAGLARETALTAVAALWRPKAGAPLGRGFWLAALAVLPLALWLGYVRWRLGPADQGFGNFTWPVTAWIDKWVEVIAAFPRHPDFRWLVTTTFLATVGLTAQAAYVIRRMRPGDPWWRLGAAQVLMMALLGTAVWEGHPGAATRVLLPLGMVFAVLAVRDRASWRWLVAGGLVAFAGLEALREVPSAPREIAAGRFPGGSYLVRLAEGWYGREEHRDSAWAWSGGAAGVEIETDGLAADASVKVRLEIRGITARPLEIWHRETRIWTGEISTARAWIELPPMQKAPARELRLELRSLAAPVAEGPGGGGRSLSFALSGARVIAANGR